MQNVLDRVTANPKFHEFIAMRSRYSIIMAIISAAAYYGFILLIAFEKQVLAARIGTGVMTWGIPVGFGVIIFTILITAYYVLKANSEFDDLNDKIKREALK